MEDYDADREIWLGPEGRSLARPGVRLARYYGHSQVAARYKRDHAVDVRNLCISLYSSIAAVATSSSFTPLPRSATPIVARAGKLTALKCSFQTRLKSGLSARSVT